MLKSNIALHFFTSFLSPHQSLLVVHKELVTIVLFCAHSWEITSLIFHRNIKAKENEHIRLPYFCGPTNSRHEMFFSSEVFQLVSHRISKLFSFINKKADIEIWYVLKIKKQRTRERSKNMKKMNDIQTVSARFFTLSMSLIFFTIFRCQEMLIYQLFIIKFQRFFYWWFKWVIKAVKSIRVIVPSRNYQFRLQKTIVQPFALAIHLSWWV